VQLIITPDIMSDLKEVVIVEVVVVEVVIVEAKILSE
jgi:hypothetical protein